MTTRTAPPLSETPIREVRRFTAGNLELRAGDDGMLTFTGYASVFDAPYDMYGGPDAGGWTEVVDPGAFRKTLSEKPDVQLLVNHEDLPLARTKSGTMKLSDDNTGLYVEATLDPNDPDVAALVPKVQRGDLDEMSFAFRTIRQEWDNEYANRRLLEVSINRGDVSIVNYGANPATSFDLRSWLDADPERALAELRSLRDAAPDLVARIRSVLTDDPAPVEDEDDGEERGGMPLGLAKAIAATL